VTSRQQIDDRASARHRAFDLFMALQPVHGAALGTLVVEPGDGTACGGPAAI
jgi:hypothetical protein